MSGSEDALLQRLGRYLDLTSAEGEAVGALQGPRRAVKNGQRLCGEGETSETIFVLQSGSAITAKSLPDDGRQILRIHHPGDLMNLACLGWSRTVATVTALGPAAVTAIDRSAFGRMFVDQPRLAALFHGVSVADNVALSDQLGSMGGTDGVARIALLLLELHARQQAGSEAVPVGMVELPLSQGGVAEAVGLSKVHVSRTFARMERDGLISRAGRQVRLLAADRLIAMSGFIDRYTQISVDWLPRREHDIGNRASSRIDNIGYHQRAA